MSREKKAQIIESLEEAFSKSKVGVMMDYRGLPTAEMTALRRKLRESGSEYRVLKNTLARLAAERAGKNSVVGALKGPMAIAFGYEEVTAPVRVLTDYIRDSRMNVSIKGGFLGNRLLTTEEVVSLATLPSKEVLLARVIGQMKSPISALVGCLTSPMRGLVGVLEAQIKKMEGK